MPRLNYYIVSKYDTLKAQNVRYSFISLLECIIALFLVNFAALRKLNFELRV